MKSGMDHWKSRAVPRMRKEALFADRVVDCFAERPGSLHAMWLNVVTRYSDREAVTHEGRRWTYAQADEQVRAMAAGWAARGINRGDRVALMLNNCPEFLFALFALQQLGAIAVPLSTREQGAGIAYMLNQCEAKGILFDAEFTDRIPDQSQVPTLVTRVVNGERDGILSLAKLALDAAQPAAPAQVNPEDTAIILYTSGTTGYPKGAMLTHVNVAHSVRHYEVAFELTCNDRAALVVPATHVTGLVAMVLAAVHAGAACVIAPPFKAADCIQFFAREAVTYTIMVPAMYSLMLLSPELDRCDLGHWRIGGYGGAPMAVSTIEELGRRLPKLGLMNAYGATETTSPTTISPVASDIAHAGSIGVALPCADVLVMNDEGQEVPTGQSGELWIAGPMIVAGYWNAPEATAAAFVGGYWRSGDIGHVDEQGFVHIGDRKKDMLSRGGFKIYSAEVENRLMAYPGVVEAAVVGKPCPVLGERVHAFVHAPEVPHTDESLRRHCAATLADYKVPESYTWTDEPLPRNANGKVLKRVLRERLLV